MVWWGKRVDRRGLVIYIAREGLAGLKNRGVEDSSGSGITGITDDKAAFVLIRAGINFMDEADIGRLLRTLCRGGYGAGRGARSYFSSDTVSRVMPGADENLQKEMTIFVAACDALQETGSRPRLSECIHAGKSGDMRGSTVLKGAGDFVFKVERSDADDPKSGTRVSGGKNQGRRRRLGQAYRTEGSRMDGGRRG